MYGIIDIGSNTMRLSCYRVVDRELSYVFHKKQMAGLAGYVEEGKLSEKGIEKAIRTLLDFRTIVRCVGLDKLYVIATASLRNISNTQEVVKRIKKEVNFDVEVISGKEEAHASYVGSTYFTKCKNGMMADIGGGSTELVFFENGNIVHSTSLPIGSLNLYSKYVSKITPKRSEIKAMRSAIRKELKKADIDVKVKNIIGVGGSNRAFCKLYNEEYDKREDNKLMKGCEIHDLVEAYIDSKQAVQKSFLKIVPDRIHTITPGMLLLDEIMKYYACDTMEISPWGVREGYMISKVL